MRILFQQLKFNQYEPVYLQVVKYFKRQILLGYLKEGDEVPSRRVLAAELGLNPTTCQKIYRILEEEGFVETQPNSKTTVRIFPGAIEKIREELIEEQAARLVQEMKANKLDFREVIEVLTRKWEEV